MQTYPNSLQKSPTNIGARNYYEFCRQGFNLQEEKVNPWEEKMNPQEEKINLQEEKLTSPDFFG